jgi:hypothetical protein
VLVENMDNALEAFPLNEVDASILYELMLCMRHIIQVRSFH